MSTEQPENEILANSQVTLHFSITLEDGTEALSTFEEDPITITMGDGNFQPGMEIALYGLKQGDEQTLELSPETAYGYPDQQLVHQMPLSDFENHLVPEVGQVIAFTMPDGQDAPGMIMDIENDKVTVDFNHPLAGHDLIFKVKILKIEQPTPETNEN
ncbi:MAG: FKBP-type peptidyl-prolyl cis-trans isomerase [Gammaproteobacteria bacterium]|jgi:FKBP-type peptidyl-prolyl cis-trans isomerase SlpA